MLSRCFWTGKGTRRVRPAGFMRRRLWVRSVGLLLVMVLSFSLCIQVGAKEEPKPIAQEWQIRGIEAALEDDRPFVWQAALDKLSGYEPQAVRSLAKQDTLQKIGNIFKDEKQNSLVRVTAALALSSFGEAAKPYIPDIAAILKDKQQDVLIRGAAASALSSFGEAAKPYIPDILVLIKDNDQLDNFTQASTRTSIVSALSDFGEVAKPYIPDIAAILKDEKQDSYVRSSAALALSNFGEATKPYIPDILAFIKNVWTDNDARNNAVSALSNFGEAAKSYIPDILTIVKDKQEDWNVRTSIVSALSNFGEVAKPYIPDIAAILKDKQQGSSIRGEAALALSNFGEVAKPYIPDTAAILKDKQQDSGTRGNAALALSNFGEAAKPYIPDILAFIKDEQQDFGVRSNAVSALSNFGEVAKPYIPDIAAVLKDKQQDSYVRSSAALALGNFGEAAKPYIPDILAFIKDEQQNYDARSNTVSALSNFGEAAKPYISDILAFIKDNQQGSDLRGNAAYELGNIARLNFDQILPILSPVYEDLAQVDQWRFHAYFLSGGDEDVKRLLKWIAKPKQLPTQLNYDEGVKTLEAFQKAWEPSKDLPEVRNDLANKTAIVAKMVSWQTQDLPLLKQHHDNLKASGSANADSVQAAITSLETWQWLSTVRTVILIHIAFWLALIFAYPRSPHIQALFFWNPWVRTIAGLGYVSALCVTLPFLQRRLFAPFQADLRKAAGLEQFDPTAYFPESRVKSSLWQAGKETEETLPLMKAIPSLKGQMMLQAPSGFGKTLFLRHLINQSPQRTIVFLTATECAQAKDQDVIQAIQAKLPIAASDPNFLKSLIYSGAIDICIDGLNEINPEAQASIKQFLSSYTRGNIILTTQPLSDKNPPQSARLYRLQPLDTDQISRFLTSRHPADAILQGEDYQWACQAYLEEALDPNQSPEDLAAIQRVLSNPMDLDTVADTLANKERPELFRLQQQLYDRMATDYASHNNGFNFPLKPLAQLAYEMRMSDQNLLPKDKLDPEAIATLEKHKLLTPKSGSWQFRHDKIWDFFIVQKYLEDPQAAYEELKAPERMRDTRLRGVYLQLATELPLPIAQALEKALFDYASSGGDHNTSDPFRKRLDSRTRSS